MIEFKETSSEYLLYVPYAEKERAKRIDGRRWDPSRKCWVYPKTKRVYQALVAEFGDESSLQSLSRPDDSAEVPRSRLQEDNQRLREQLTEIQSTLESLSTADQQNGEIRALRVALRSKNEEIERLESRLRSKEDELGEMRAELSTTYDRLTETQNHAAHEDSGISIGQLAKEAAKNSTGGNERFARVVDRFPLDAMFPLQIAKSLEAALRYRLENSDRDASLFDLISEARDAELLPDEAFDLAHTIRRQRNMLAHYEVDPRTQPGRILLVLFASAILWPYLTDWEPKS